MNIHVFSNRRLYVIKGLSLSVNVEENTGHLRIKDRSPRSSAERTVAIFQSWDGAVDADNLQDVEPMASEEEPEETQEERPSRRLNIPNE